MNLRFNVRQITACVNHTICGITGDLVVPTTVDITSYVNGVASTTNTTPANVYTLAIPTLNVWDEVVVHIKIELTDYNTFENTFTFYGYDVGAYLNGLYNSILGGFDITLIKTDYRTVNEADPTHVDYIPYILNLAYSSFIAIRRPFTKEIQYYKTNSANSTVTYELSDDTVITSGFNGLYCSSEDILLKQRTKTYTTVNSGCCGQADYILLSECESSLINVKKVEWLAQTVTSVYSNACDNDAVNTLTTNYTQQQINFANVTCVNIDDDLKAPFNELYLRQTLYAIGSTIESGIIQGVELDSNELLIDDSIVDLDNPISVIDSDYGYGSIFTYLWESFQTIEIGEYKLLTELIFLSSTGEEIIVCRNIQVINSSNWFFYEQTECGVYTLYNKSFVTITIVVSKLNDSNVYEVTGTYTLDACTLATLTLTDGVYSIEAQRTGHDSVVYSVVAMCSLQACWLNYQKKLLCCTPEDVCSSKDVYIYNTMSAQIQILFTLLNEIYNFGMYFSIIDSNELAKLYQINSVLNRINTEYCLECSIPSNCATQINYSIGCTSCP